MGAEGALKQPQKPIQSIVFCEEPKSTDRAISGALENVKNAPRASDDDKYATGDHVEFCNDQGKWIPAVVKSASLNSKGAVMFYDLDCQKAVRLGEVRRLSPTAAAAIAASAATA